MSETAVPKTPEEVVVAEIPTPAPGPLPGFAALQAATAAVNAATVLSQQSPLSIAPSTGNILAPTLPDYALKYAPLLYLHPKEQYYPGNPIEHLANTTPYTKNNVKIEIPEELQGKAAMLSLPQVNQDEVYLVLNVSGIHSTW
jgi:hypothetical protein